MMHLKKHRETNKKLMSQKDGDTWSGYVEGSAGNVRKGMVYDKRAGGEQSPMDRECAATEKWLVLKGRG